MILCCSCPSVPSKGTHSFRLFILLFDQLSECFHIAVFYIYIFRLDIFSKDFLKKDQELALLKDNEKIYKVDDDEERR